MYILSHCNVLDPCFCLWLKFLLKSAVLASKFAFFVVVVIPFKLLDDRCALATKFRGSPLGLELSTKRLKLSGC